MRLKQITSKYILDRILAIGYQQSVNRSDEERALIRRVLTRLMVSLYIAIDVGEKLYDESMCAQGGLK